MRIVENDLRHGNVKMNGIIKKKKKKQTKKTKQTLLGSIIASDVKKATIIENNIGSTNGRKQSR